MNERLNKQQANHLASLFPTPLVILLISAFLLGAETLRAGISCPDACSAMSSLQSYGTEDPACLAACEENTGPCARSWGAYFQCLGANATPESCWTAYADAKQCSSCDFGDVDLEGLDTALFVNNEHYVNNQLVCSQNINQGGTFNLPYCDFSLGIDKALELQADGRSSKVVVCPGTYLENYDGQQGKAGSTTSTPQVIVESVVRGEAVITGSEDWTGAWQPVNHTINETLNNEFLRSIDPADSTVWWRQNLNLLTAVAPPQPPTADPGLVRGFTADTTTGEHLLVQALPPQGARRVTFSVYIYPQGVDHFRLLLLKDNDGVPNPVGYSQAAWYDFELPATPSCTFENSSRDGFGYVEPVGTTGWYRVSLTQTFDTDPEDHTGNPPLLTGVRLHLLGPQGEVIWKGDNTGAFIFGPQLDHRPLGEFGTRARDYVWTDATPASNPVTTVKTLYVNNPAVKTWTHDWGLAMYGGWGDLQPIVRRSEMVFVEGAKLRQELSFADLRPGSFLVDDGISYAGTNYVKHLNMVPGSCSDSQPCSIYIDPPPGVNMASTTSPLSKVEVAQSPRLLWMNPVRQWEFRGLVFQHATGAFDKEDGGDSLEVRLSSGVSFNNAAELTLLENNFEWNSSLGLGVSGTVNRADPNSADSNIRLIRNTVRHNGIAGMFLGGCQNCEVTEDEYSYNNWSGAQGHFQGHTTAGAKYAANINTIIRGLTASNNFGHGLWLDYENQQMQVLESAFENNLGTGLYFEANDEWCSPVANTTNYVIKCTITGNDIGVHLIGSRGTRLSLNQLVGNRIGLSMAGDPYNALDKACYPLPPHTTPQKWLRDVYYDNNTFNASCPGDLWIYYSDVAGDLSRWQPVMLSLSSWNNTYSHVEGLGTRGIKMLGELFTLDDWKSCDPNVPPVAPWCFKAQDQGSIEQ